MSDVLAAARSGQDDRLLSLLQAGFPVDAQDREGFTALHKACARDHIRCARLLVDNGADPSARSRTGWTPLLKACDGGAARCARFLLELGPQRVDPAECSDSGKTPLMRACRNSHIGCVRVLLAPNVSRHPQLDARDAEGYTAIHRAVQHDADDDILNLVGGEMRAKMHPNAKGETPMHTAVSKRDVRIMAKVLSFGAGANVADGRGWTATHLAAEMGDFRILKWIVLEAGGRADVRSAVDGETPLHRAAWGGDATCVKLLVDHGAPINSKTKAGWTPAHCAAWVGAEQALKYLATRGARLDEKNDDGWTADQMMPGSAKSTAPPRGRGPVAKGKADVFKDLLETKDVQVTGQIHLP